MAVVVASAFTPAAFAEPPPGNLGQLQQLNRSSDAQLRYLQRPPASSPATSNRAERQESIHRRQRAELQRLQEGQRRETLLLNQRARTGTNSGPADSLRGIQTRSRFQRQQQYQLNRFRLQRQRP
jgi:hypothetical protein